MTDAAQTTDVARTRITDRDEVMFRPIIRAWMPHGDITPSAFKLNDRDRADSNRLSVARASVTTAENAYDQRADAIKRRCEEHDKPYRPPIGVLAVTVADIESVTVEWPAGTEQRRPLTAWDDSMNADIPDTHGHIDFTELPPTERGIHELAAKALLSKALANGWKFGPFNE